jgi:general secretion pathway protein B
LQDTEKPAASPQPAALPPADPEKVYRLKELPAALQKTLPSISLSAFMYSSNPALRVVRINNQMMREGQELTAGIRLQEITTDGVILASQGYRFFVAMK